MYTFCLNATRVLVVLFLICGFAVVAGQTAAIAIGSAALMTTFGSDVAEVACALAGLSGVFAFLLLYTREGKEKAGDLEE
ncbi:hypothetical protein ACFUN8_08760 [Streptomyces sp. NPDC057307]|uniref:hypothetical protein n=1 Tax=Streptomyces sp. NPDC057307 TaxID=3346096 RepID=UPI00362B559E